MNKIKVFANAKTLIAMCLFMALGIQGFSAVKSKDLDLEWNNRINNISTQVDMRYTPVVKKQIQMYTERYRKGSERLLGRVSVYFPIFENELRSRQLPDELKYLSVIESSLDANARSYIGATGLWQFMKGTGKMYGLTINSTIDERKDPFRSTAAALDYLSDLYDQFGDWTLALAAYNCGPGNVRKAIRRSGGQHDYWSIRKFLPRETQKYIPKFIAATYLMNYYHDHDLVPELPEDHLRITATAEVHEKIGFNNLSAETGIDLEIIKALNPAYKKSYIPDTKKSRTLTLPEASMFKYLQAKNGDYRLLYSSALGFDKRSSQYGLRNIKSMPVLSAHGFIDSNKVEPFLLSKGVDESNINNRKYVYHRINRRESLMSIAEMYEGVEFATLLRINDISFTKLPPVGAFIKIREL